MSTVFAFVFTLGVLIVVHEWGHYIVARLAGVKVLRFCVGFGKPLWTRRRGDTEWVVAAFPLGGYVKMLDEREAPVAEAEVSRAFNRQSVWRRIAIVAAGPVANLLLAVLLYWVLFMSGVTGLKPVLGEPQAGSPAAAAGFASGDTVSAVAGEAVKTWEDVRWALLRHGGDGRAIEVAVTNGRRSLVRLLPSASLEASDLDGDLVKKLGLRPFEPAMPPVVTGIQPGSPAARAGLLAGDRIVAVAGNPVREWKNLVQVVRANPGKALEVQVERMGAGRRLSVTPDTIAENGMHIGRIGAAARPASDAIDALLVKVRYDPVSAAKRAVARTWDTSVLSLSMLWHMVRGEASLKNLSGPVTIAEYAGKSLDLGIEAFVAFLAVISISLGVINLLPVPLLDGGHLLYYFAEILTGRPVSERVMLLGQRVGIAFIATLMALALYNDFQRLLTQ